MTSKTRSSLSIKRIIISLLIIMMIPVCAHFLNRLVDFYEVSLMFSMTIGTTLLIVYDWNLFGIHYNRSKSAPGDTLLYTVIGIVLIGIWTLICQKMIACDVFIPSGTMLIRNGYARIGLLFAYSFMYASMISIGFKCITDHMDVRSRELQAILISAISSGIFFTAIFITSVQPLLWICDLAFNMIQFAILSYLYNQSSSFMPGLIAVSFVHFLLMILSIL